MNDATETLTTPIYHKIDETTEPPDHDAVCHVLAGNGLFTRRKHRFFTSCVRARNWPSELAPQKQYLELHGPKLSWAAMERIVGFFSRIAELHGAEAAALLFWDRRKERIRFKIPEQRATVTECWNGSRYASDVHYETPQVSDDLSLFGSVHSHVDAAAYASPTDRADESYLTGLHIVVGKIQHEPPEVHCEYVVDGVRFKVDARTVIEGYRRRNPDVPEAWIKRVKVELDRYESRSTYYGGSYDRGPARWKNAK
jgi:proteasome lid subunit RPN8/RPN11